MPSLNVHVYSDIAGFIWVWVPCIALLEMEMNKAGEDRQLQDIMTFAPVAVS